MKIVKNFQNKIARKFCIDTFFVYRYEFWKVKLFIANFKLFVKDVEWTNLSGVPINDFTIEYNEYTLYSSRSYYSIDRLIRIQSLAFVTRKTRKDTS